MSRLLYFMFLIIAISLYWNSPEGYSIEFCSLIALIYILQSLFFVIKTNRFGFLSFDTFFLISFFLACFAYPVFFYNIDLRIFSKINVDVVNKSTALALVGANAYMLGMLIKQRKGGYIIVKKNFIDLKLLKKNSNILIFISYLLCISFVFVGGLNYLKAYNGLSRPNLSIALGVLDILKIVFVVCSLYVFLILPKNINFSGVMLKINKYYFILYIALILILLMGGTRNLPIQMLLVIMCLYNLIIKKIGGFNVLLMIAMGFIFFTIIRIGREDLSSTKNAFSGAIPIGNKTDSSPYVIDFLGSSATLYTLVDEADTKGISYGKSMLLPALSVIPFLQSSIISLFNLDDKGYFLTSSLLSTDLIFDSFDSGAGTNIIGDLYYSFGFFGVVSFMFFLGFFISFLTNNIVQTQNLASIVAYLCLFSLCFFIVRVEFMFFIRYLVWSVLLFKILNYSNRKKVF